MKQCKTCNREFEAKDPRKQYCSDKCKWTFDNKRALKKVADKKIAIKIEDLPGEIWKEIEGFEGLYQISNIGRVKGLICKKLGKRGFDNVKFLFPERILEGNISRYGYRKYILTKDHKQSSVFQHRLIAIAFIPNPEKLDTVNHIDGNKLNNNLENLEWCSIADNVKHAFITGLNNSYERSTTKGVQKHAVQVQCVRTGKVWPSIKAACSELNTNPSSLKRILNGISKSCSDYVYYNPGPSTPQNV